jgi:alpha-tubulin suppressor-like RCC1 family protein
MRSPFWEPGERLRRWFLAIAAVLVVGMVPSPGASASGVGPSLVPVAWGANNTGQLGDGSYDSSNVPVRVRRLDQIVSVAEGGSHSLAVSSDGTIWAWGLNSTGQLGDGTNRTRKHPSRVVGLTGAVAIAAGQAHSLALMPDGAVWAWGLNSFGQLGDGSSLNSRVPVQVTGLTDVVAVAAGSNHSLAVRSDGTVWSWGWNDRGQLGDGSKVPYSTVPVEVSGITDAVAVAGGGAHSLALAADGTVWAWGTNGNGQLGDPWAGNMSRTPVRVHRLDGAVAVAAGLGHSLAIRSDGTVWAWGSNRSGQLGDGTIENRRLPVRVEGLGSAVAVSAGIKHSVAVLADGAVRAWGDGYYGQLGNGKNVLSTVPVPVLRLSDATVVSAGGNSNLAVARFAKNEEPAIR